MCIRITLQCACSSSQEASKLRVHHCVCSVFLRGKRFFIVQLHNKVKPWAGQGQCFHSLGGCWDTVVWCFLCLYNMNNMSAQIALTEWRMIFFLKMAVNGGYWISSTAFAHTCLSKERFKSHPDGSPSTFINITASELNYSPQQTRPWSYRNRCTLMICDVSPDILF